MLNYFDFEEIRPYHANEFAAAWQRIHSNPNFSAALAYVFSPEEKAALESDFPEFSSTKDFQLKIMHKAIRNILKKSSKGLSYSGFERIQPNQNYTFIANHRDIFLDSGILQILLVENGHDTSEITFGSNLMIDQFLIDVGKVNKMFTVHRTGNRRELYENSMRLSNYMRHAILSKKQSTWIAQRNGRTKNGCDETQVAVLKMLFASKPDNFIESFKELNIAPVCISYEYEPCDALKVREIYASRNGSYTKAPGEDLKSILCGITEQKGKIHLEICQPIQEELIAISLSSDPFKALCQYMDKEMHRAFKLFPGNYVAFDLMQHAALYAHKYSPAEKEFFLDYMHGKLNTIAGDKDELQKIFLSIYANPVVNALKTISVLN